jgi:hypothetical protein
MNVFTFLFVGVSDPVKCRRNQRRSKEVNCLHCLLFIIIHVLWFRDFETEGVLKPIVVHLQYNHNDGASDS